MADMDTSDGEQSGGAAAAPPPHPFGVYNGGRDDAPKRCSVGGGKENPGRHGATSSTVRGVPPPAEPPPPARVLPPARRRRSSGLRIDSLDPADALLRRHAPLVEPRRRSPSPPRDACAVVKGYLDGSLGLDACAHRLAALSIRGSEKRRGGAIFGRTKEARRTSLRAGSVAVGELPPLDTPTGAGPPPASWLRAHALNFGLSRADDAASLSGAAPTDRGRLATLLELAGHLLSTTIASHDVTNA